MSATPEISVVVPVYNEEESLPALFESLYPVMEKMGRSFEIIFTNDGSRDKSFAMLYDFQKKHPDTVRLIDLNGNFGQHMAIMAAFDRARGSKIVTLDADLQNPPEEIPRLITEMDKGHDVVGTCRVSRHDPLFRKLASKIVNKVTNRITGLHIGDYGCMLRAYDRRIVEIINQSCESSTFIPALGQKYAANPVEIPVQHREREKGQSKYSLFALIRLNFDLMTSFSLVPLQWLTMSGIVISLLSLLLVAYLLVRRLIVGPEAEGLFTLMAIQFFLAGITVLSLGVVGEYIGRISRQVQRRPRYAVRRVYGDDNEK